MPDMPETLPESTHAERVLPTPSIGVAESEDMPPDSLKNATIALLNEELNAERAGLGSGQLPLGSLVVASAENARKATTDSMTGLLNRDGLRLWYERYAQACMGILVADARGFKTVNDMYGEDFGDRVIKFIAKQFESKLRTTSIQTDEERRRDAGVRDKVAVCRWGGDEIVAAVDLCGVPVDERDSSMKKIQERLEQFGTYSDKETGVSGVDLALRSVYTIIGHNDGEILDQHLEKLNMGIVRAKIAESSTC